MLSLSPLVLRVLPYVASAIGILFLLWWVYDLGREHEAAKCEAARVQAVESQRKIIREIERKQEQTEKEIQRLEESDRERDAKNEQDLQSEGLSCPFPPDLDRRLRGIQ